VQAHLLRYPHRVAISNCRLLSLDESGVTLRCKNYHANKDAKGKVRHTTTTPST
jgi:hypothetical protein